MNSPAQTGTLSFRFHPGWFYLIFAASGFAGLIYESVWTRYLKLFLGHAALAQALVLAIFLFGLAAGSAVASRFSHRIRRPLLAYAVIEAVIALAAIGFHDIYLATTAWLLDTLLPTVGSGTAGSLLKWSLGAALILPQSLLLGATFPLMSAGLVRQHPEKPGGVVAMLYFSNSFGAAMGVIISGFTLIPGIGLPGTVIAAGLINIAVALVVWAMDNRLDPVPPFEAPTDRPKDQPSLVQRSGWWNRLTALILAAALLTGFASLVYEIVWIRMLSLLLGSSTHSFELMLSAFILGLAIGGFLVRHRTDRATEPLALLGWIQIVMGALALTSLFLYPLFFHALAKILQVLPKTGTGYNGLLTFHFIIANAMMLPTTVCAGMTLPLLTRKLMNVGGEQAVGAVYAANTLGAILAVGVTGSFLMPAFGIKAAFAIGAVTDLGLGLALIAFAAPVLVRRATVATLVALVAVAYIKLDPLMLSSAVYRQGHFDPDQFRKNIKLLFYRDGHTASVAVTERISSEKDPQHSWLKPAAEPATELPIRTIATNGKPDASVYPLPLREGNRLPVMTRDETTMVLTGLLPLMARPDARLAANIGLGSGLTTRTLLLSPRLERVDTIEIEEMMAQGARHMGPRVSDVFSDPRSRVIIDDARSFFAATQEKYDILVSEPSNPWVSGVANLFTREFYHRLRKTLAENGVFVQWLHLYETDHYIYSSVALALADAFSDYRMYLSGSADVIFVAVPEGVVPDWRGDIFSFPVAREILSRYRFRNTADVDFFFLGNRERMHPYFQLFNAPVNSDYFPYVENNAPRAFFLKSRYPLGGLLTLPIPLYETLYGIAPPARRAEEMMSPLPDSELLRTATDARRLADSLDEEDGEFSRLLSTLATGTCARRTEEKLEYFDRVNKILLRMAPFWSAHEVRRGWAALEKIPCVSSLLTDAEPVGRLLRMWRASGVRDDAEILRLVSELGTDVDYGSTQGLYTLLSSMVAHYRLRNWTEVRELSSRLPPSAIPVIAHASTLLAVNAVEHLRREEAEAEGRVIPPSASR